MKLLEKPHLITAVRTHAGMSGKNNEDRYSISAFTLDTPTNMPALLAVLADGIGGHRAGEIAADIVVKSIPQYVSQGSDAEPIRTLVGALHNASRQVYEEGHTSPQRHGMGATCAAAWIIGNNLYTATVGDSRIYLIRGRVIKQISIDHTWVQEALDLGLLTPEQVVNHPNAHIIRRYMGAPKPPDVDLRMRLAADERDEKSVNNQGYLLTAGDTILLCSDGLTDLVTDLEILKAFRQMSLEDAVENLMNLANLRGGFDNITVVAIKVPENNLPPRKKRSRLLFFLGLLGVAAILAGLVMLLGYS